MKKARDINPILINIVCVLALTVIVFPLLFIAKYNYPSADDWSYGAAGYNVIKNGGNIIDVLKVSLDTVKQTWANVEGRYAAIFLATLQPGIWGEQYYVVVPWIMIGAIVLSELFFFKALLCEECKVENKWLWIPVIIPALILQLLYCPFPEESFYWYTGSVYYTFSFGLSLVLLVLFWRLGMKSYTKVKYVLMALVACLIAVYVGGANFGTSLACLLGLSILSVLFIIYDKKAFIRTWFINLAEGISLMICIFAPGNTNRIINNFDGETIGAVDAVFMSLSRSAINIYSWTNIKVVLLMLFALPFVWKCVNNMKYHFKLPGLFFILTFGLYASQATPTMYVNGTTGGGRMAAVLYYSYFVWLIGNEIYLLGWLSKRKNRVQNVLDKGLHILYKYIIPYCAVIGVILVGVIYIRDLREVSSYKAYRNWKQGWAQQYAEEWDERLQVLHDDNIKEVEFGPLSVYPEMLYYSDLQDEYGYVWVNEACATYYGKESIVVHSKDLK